MSRYASLHVNPQGPGDVRPTALQIIKDEDLVGKLSGRVFFITGCSDGLGVETAKAIHATGATVYAAGRNEEKTKAAIERILASDPANKAPIHFVQLDLSSLASVRKAAEGFLKTGSKLNVLINNAGIMAVPEGRTVDGFETQLGTNHLGHFLLFQLLKPRLLESSTPEFPSRVVSLTSTSHRNGGIRFDDFNFEKESYDPWLAYGQSKTANIYFANEIERRYGSKRLHATSVHPGVIFTNIGAFLTQEQVDGLSTPKWLSLRKSPEQGAATSVYAAVSKEWANKGGKYLANLNEAKASDGSGPGDTGYASWAYDEAAEKKLWEASLKFVGLADDD